MELVCPVDTVGAKVVEFRDASVICSPLPCRLEVTDPAIETLLLASTILNGSSVLLRASGPMSIDSTSVVSADGLSPLSPGPGATGDANGASHGGAGGRAPCAPLFWGDACCSNADFLLPTPNLTDASLLGSAINASRSWALGWGSSSGRKPGAGRGGGRIGVQASGWLDVNGTLTAAGAMADDKSLGAGAGGIVLVSALGLRGSGTIDASGGDARESDPLQPRGDDPAGAAGGGGRVFVSVGTVDAGFDLDGLRARGGVVRHLDHDASVRGCRAGGAGTVTVEDRGVPGGGAAMTVLVDNGGAPAWGLTPVDVPAGPAGEGVAAVSAGGAANVLTSGLWLPAGGKKRRVGGARGAGSSPSRRVRAHLLGEGEGDVGEESLILVKDATVLVRKHPARPSGGDDDDDGGGGADDDDGRWLGAEPDAPRPPPPHLQAADITLLGKASLVAQATVVQLLATNVSVGASSQVTSDRSVLVRATNAVSVAGSVRVDAVGVDEGEPTSVLSLGLRGDRTVLVTGQLQAPALALSAGTNLTVTGSAGATGTLGACQHAGQAGARAPCADLTGWLPTPQTPHPAPLNFSAVLISGGWASVGPWGAGAPALAQLRASSVAVCAILGGSVSGVVQTAGLGCGAEKGPGAGASFQPGVAAPRQAVTGAGHGGAGGPDGMGHTGGAAYGGSGVSAAQFSGSGGGSGGVSSAGGAGGGFVRLSAPVLTVAGAVTADGAAAQGSGGGGSGGTVVLRTDSLQGAGQLSALGGDATGAGGGGGGGRIVVGTLTRPSAGRNTFAGALLLAAGTGAGKGAPGGAGVLGMPPCDAGSAGVNCEPCALGTFKETAGTAACSRCSNRPLHSRYTGAGSTARECPYECEGGLVYPLCVGFLQGVFEDAGSVGGAAAVSVAAASVVALALGAMCRRRCGSGDALCGGEPGSAERVVFGAKRDRAVRAAGQAGSAWAGSSQAASGYGTIAEGAASGSADRPQRLAPLQGRGTVCACVPRAACGLPGFEGAAPLTTLRDSDVPKLVHRLYLDGNNTPSRPWRLPERAPAAAEALLRPGRYAKFARRLNEQLRWGWDGAAVQLAAALAPGVSDLLLAGGRFARAAALAAAVADEEERYAGGSGGMLRCPARSGRVRVYVSSDLTVSSVDLTRNEERGSAGAGSGPEPASTDAVAASDHGLRAPVVLVFCGEGSAVSPLHLDACDPLVRSLPRLRGLTDFVDEAWPQAFTALNATARAVRRQDVPGTAGPLLGAARAIGHPTHGVLGRAGVRLTLAWVAADDFPEQKTERAASQGTEGADAARVDAGDWGGGEDGENSSQGSWTGRQGTSPVQSAVHSTMKRPLLGSADAEGDEVPPAVPISRLRLGIVITVVSRQRADSAMLSATPTPPQPADRRHDDDDPPERSADFGSPAAWDAPPALLAAPAPADGATGRRAADDGHTSGWRASGGSDEVGPAADAALRATGPAAGRAPGPDVAVLPSQRNRMRRQARRGRGGAEQEQPDATYRLPSATASGAAASSGAPALGQAGGAAGLAALQGPEPAGFAVQGRNGEGDADSDDDDFVKPLGHDDDDAIRSRPAMQQGAGLAAGGNSARWPSQGGGSAARIVEASASGVGRDWRGQRFLPRTACRACCDGAAGWACPALAAPGWANRAVTDVRWALWAPHRAKTRIEPAGDGLVRSDVWFAPWEAVGRHLRAADSLVVRVAEAEDLPLAAVAMRGRPTAMTSLAVVPLSGLRAPLGFAEAGAATVLASGAGGVIAGPGRSRACCCRTGGRSPGPGKPSPAAGTARPAHQQRQPRPSELIEAPSPRLAPQIAPASPPGIRSKLADRPAAPLAGARRLRFAPDTPGGGSDRRLIRAESGGSGTGLRPRQPRVSALTIGVPDMPRDRRTSPAIPAPAAGCSGLVHASAGRCVIVCTRALTPVVPAHAIPGFSRSGTPGWSAAATSVPTLVPCHCPCGGPWPVVAAMSTAVVAALCSTLVLHAQFACVVDPAALARPGPITCDGAFLAAVLALPPLGMLVACVSDVAAVLLLTPWALRLHTRFNATAVVGAVVGLLAATAAAPSLGWEGLVAPSALLLLRLVCMPPCAARLTAEAEHGELRDGASSRLAGWNGVLGADASSWLPQPKAPSSVVTPIAGVPPWAGKSAPAARHPIALPTRATSTASLGEIPEPVSLRQELAAGARRPGDS